jgi:hypothetical protein
MNLSPSLSREEEEEEVPLQPQPQVQVQPSRQDQFKALWHKLLSVAISQTKGAYEVRMQNLQQQLLDIQAQANQRALIDSTYTETLEKLLCDRARQQCENEISYQVAILCINARKQKQKEQHPELFNCEQYVHEGIAEWLTQRKHVMDYLIQKQVRFDGALLDIGTIDPETMTQIIKSKMIEF